MRPEIRTRALHVHEVGIWRLYESLELVSPALRSGAGVKKIDGESLSRNDKIQRQYHL